MSLASLLKKGSLRGVANAIPANVAKHTPDTLPTLARLATLTLAKAPDTAANDPAPTPKTAALDPDRHCWPHSEAMNSGEVGAFTARLARFTAKGVTHTDGEALADKLVTRDRESDDRRLCLECSHLSGHAGSWRCRDWQRAGIAIQSRDAGLPGDLVRTLQRCDGFKAVQG
jgi:hypothetical protein